MPNINFVLEGREYSATFNGDGDCEKIYSVVDGRFLAEDPETNKREKPYVWVTAYAMLDY